MKPKIYGPYTRADGRQHIILYEKGKCLVTKSYPKYLLEQKLGRLLLRSETCDHINGDYTDNRIENLQVLTRGDNSRKHAALAPQELGVFTCPVCIKSFTREMNYVRSNLKKGKRGPYCSRSCAGKAGRKHGLVAQ